MAREAASLTWLHDLAELLHGSFLGLRLVAITPGNDFQHLRPHVAFSAFYRFKTAGSGPVFLVEREGVRRRAVPVAIEDMNQAPAVFKNGNATPLMVKILLATEPRNFIPLAGRQMSGR